MFPNATSGAILLQISAITVVFSVLAQTANGALQGLGKIMVPAVSGFLGLIVKIISNIILIKIPEIGVNNIVVFLISYIILKKSLRLQLKPNKFIIKPLIATIIMSVCSYTLYTLLVGTVIPEKIVTIISLCFAVTLYFVSVIVLKIFEKEELAMIPYGTKLCKILERLGIYRK